MSEVPVGWRLVRLGDVAETALGKMLDAARPRGASRVSYLRNLNVQWGRIDLDDVQEVLLNEDEKLRFALEPGDLLVCEGGEIGRAAIWRGGSEYMAYQKALHRVRSRGDLDLSFLRYLLEHYASTGDLRRRATGSTILHLPQRQLRELPILLPPLPEQRRIVEVLENHLSRLDAAAVCLDQARSRALAAATTAVEGDDRVVNSPRRPLSELLAAPLSNGRSVKDRADGFPVLRLTCLQSGRVDLTQRKAGDWTANEAARFLVKQGDFLVARGNGSLRLVGRGGLVLDKPEDVAFPDTLIRVRTAPASMDPMYLAMIWESRDVRRQIEARARTTAGIYKINQRDLENILLPVPSLRDQVAIHNDVATRQGELSRLDAAIGFAQRRAVRLRRSIMSAAFAGLLRTTGQVGVTASV